MSGKSSISSIGSASADVDQNGYIDLVDGFNLINSITNSKGSKLIIVDDTGSPEISVWPEETLNLMGVLVGDLDASYSPEV